MRAAVHAATCWKLYAPRFFLNGVKLDDLKARGRNAKEDVKKADEIIATMQDQPADALSGEWMDEDGNTLLCVFSHHLIPDSENAKVSIVNPPLLNDRDLLIQDTPASKCKAVVYPGSSGRTLSALEAAPRSRRKRDGLPVSPLADLEPFLASELTDKWLARYNLTLPPGNSNLTFCCAAGY